MPGVRATYCENVNDSEGRAIREDVRQAAKTMWNATCSRTRAVLGDDVEAAEILERCVSRVSRYLDARGVGLFTQNVNALLFVSFRRELWSMRSRRRIPVEINACADHLRDSSWSEIVELHLDLQSLIRQLSDRSRTVLYLRRAGYGWKEVAALLRTTVPEVKSSFWRELVRLKSKFAASRLNDNPSVQSAEIAPNCKALLSTTVNTRHLACYFSGLLPKTNLKNAPMARPT
jgi:DNA-directed RNA polymerase specialized sigma24 family protein